MNIVFIWLPFLINFFFFSVVFGADTNADINQTMLDEILHDSHLTEQQKRFLIYENFANGSVKPSDRRDSSGCKPIHPKSELHYFKVPLRLVREFRVDCLLNPKIREAL